MRRSRGFRMGRKLVRVFKWVCCRRRRKPSSGYLRLGASDYKSKTMTKIFNWGRCIKRGAKELCFSNNNKSSSSLSATAAASSDRYQRLDLDPFMDPKPVSVPKGHLAVYVGDKDDDYHRYLVPVFYFNHPLFSELLREAEKEYGFEHPGGITIPCQISKFENVKTKIAAGAGPVCRKTTRRMPLAF